MRECSGATDGEKLIMPLVSVIIPSYNSGRYLPETLGSIVAQTFRDFEIIIIDDGSQDNTEEIVAEIGSPMIQYLKQLNSGGPSKPRNVGVDIARGKYISLFDSDDVMFTTKLADAVSFLSQQPHLGLVFTNFVLCDENGRQFQGTFLDKYDGFKNLPKEQKRMGQFVIKGQMAYGGLIKENYIGTSGVVIPKSVFDKVGKFDESLSVAEDWDMWLRISKSYDIGYLDVIGHRYRRRETGLMSRTADTIAPQQIRFMRKQLDQGLSSSLTTPARRFIAEAFFGLGYYYQCEGHLKLARQNYWLSLRETFSWQAVKGIFLSCLGGRLLAYMRNLRKISDRGVSSTLVR